MKGSLCWWTCDCEGSHDPFLTWIGSVLSQYRNDFFLMVIKGLFFSFDLLILKNNNKCFITSFRKVDRLVLEKVTQNSVFLYQH